VHVFAKIGALCVRAGGDRRSSYSAAWREKAERPKRENARVVKSEYKSLFIAMITPHLFAAGENGEKASAPVAGTWATNIWICHNRSLMLAKNQQCKNALFGRISGQNEK
jgi:hypothetical protein